MKKLFGSICFVFGIFVGFICIVAYLGELPKVFKEPDKYGSPLVYIVTALTVTITFPSVLIFGGKFLIKKSEQNKVEQTSKSLNDSPKF